MISIKDFQKLELKVAEVREAEDIEGADKLFKLKIDAGGAEKQIVAGIKNRYSKEELIGKQIIIIDNLEPATLRGIKSEGMLLAVEGGPLVVPDRKAEPGKKVV